MGGAASRSLASPVKNLKLHGKEQALAPAAACQGGQSQTERVEADRTAGPHDQSSSLEQRTAAEAKAEAEAASDAALVSRMRYAMSLPTGAIEFTEQLLPLSANDDLARAMTLQAEFEMLSSKSVYERRAVSELPGAGRVSLEEMKHLIGLLQTNGAGSKERDLLALQFNIEMHAVSNVAKFYCIPKVKSVAFGDSVRLVADRS